MELKRKLWLTLAYPALTVVVTLLLLSGVCAILVGQFELIYKDFGVPLPRLTVALIFLSHSMNHALNPLAGVLAAVFCAWLACRVFLTRAQRRGFACSIPLLGAVWRSMSLAEFCHLLALLVEGRLPLGEALKLTGQGVEDASIDRDCKVMAGRIEAGESLAQAMASRPRFPIGLARLLRWGENQKSVPEVLHMAGSIFEARARSQSTFVGVALNFLCVIMVFCMILIVPALFMPLITLISRLSG